MSYHPLGISTDNWCSTQMKKPGCTPVSGICLPTNASTLSQVKQAQRNVNRLRHVRGEPLIDVDGRIGPATTRAIRTEADQTGTNQFGPLPYCDNAMALLDEINAFLSTMVVKVAAPPVADPRPRTPPSVPRPDGGVSHPAPSAMKAGMGLEPLLILGIGAALIYHWGKAK